ncbi:hypothetical protein A2U01_0100588, partial [Trifolium medium]|nr:hypothetical protein [Trifolium medium]
YNSPNAIQNKQKHSPVATSRQATSGDRTAESLASTGDYWRQLAIASPAPRLAT